MKWMLDINELNVDWQYKTGDGYQCVCEFHDDTHPSMFVNCIEQTFYCFACGEYGRIDKLLDVTGGVKRWVANTTDSKTIVGGGWTKKLSYSSAHNDSYVIGRGVTGEQIDKFGILSNHDEVVFPLRNEMGDLVGVKIRIKRPRGNVKYLTFGKQPTVVKNFGSDWDGQVMVTEGIFGMLAFDRVGVKCVTPLSANRVNGMQVLFNHKPQTNFILFFDNDVAGLSAAAKGVLLGAVNWNVFGMYQFQDVDVLSNEALLHIATGRGESLSYTHDPNYFLGVIEKQYGKTIYKQHKKRFDKFAKDIT